MSWYIVEDTRHTPPQQTRVELEDVLNHVSAAELEIFESNLAREEVPPPQPSYRRTKVDSGVSSRSRGSREPSSDVSLGKRKAAIGAETMFALLPKKRKRLAAKEYEVEDIVDHRLRNGLREYRVRWVDYGSEDDTWQVEDELIGAKEVLREYCATSGIVPQLLSTEMDEDDDR